ncbi:MAG: hypothetical protein HKN24_00195 [Acidimicrobiales bacterium]|nr:hypothetical protein [Acidimicrobiales bacterium]
MMVGNGVHTGQTTDLLAPMGRLRGPSARVVLAVLQQALLTPLGADRLVLGVKGIHGRLTVVSTDASNAPERGRSQFRWSRALPIIGSLRRQRPGTAGSIHEVAGRFLYSYAIAVENSTDTVVLGVVLNHEPERVRPLHAAVSSALYSLLPQSDGDIPDACVAVSVESAEAGFRSTVGYSGDHDVVTVQSAAATVAAATAAATIGASTAPLRLRFADQIAVGQVLVSLVVADGPAGSVIGSSDLSSPGTVAPAIAVLKAANAQRIITAEADADPARIAVPTMAPAV